MLSSVNVITAVEQGTNPLNLTYLIRFFLKNYRLENLIGERVVTARRNYNKSIICVWHVTKTGPMRGGTLSNKRANLN